MPITLYKAGTILNYEFREKLEGTYIYLGLGVGQVPNKYGFYKEVSFIGTNYNRIPISLTGQASGWGPYGPTVGGSYAIDSLNDIIFGGEAGASANWSIPGEPDTYIRYLLFFSTQTPIQNDLLFWGYLYDGTGNFLPANRVSTGNVTLGRNFNIPKGKIEIHLQNDYS